jgi:predicted NAD/FAD-binding protein
VRPVAVVGSGIAGLSAAYLLADAADVTLFEAGAHFGGHTNTVDLTLDGRTHGVDTGFLVFNERTDPNLIRLFDELGVPTSASDMSFSVQWRDRGFEWSGRSLDAVFAQRRNLARPAFWRMLADIARFNRVATAIARRGADDELLQTVGDFLDAHRFGDGFRDGYFLPMVGSIWSCPTAQMLQFPIATMIRFCHNHGLLQMVRRPRWFTVTGGARQYVQKMLARIPDARLNTPVRRVRRMPPGEGSAGVWVHTDAGAERFDELVLACHAGQSLSLLGDATPTEREVLGAIRTQRNRAVLHTDVGMLPTRRLAWAAWNYERGSDGIPVEAPVCLHYLINRLQPLPFETPVIVSLNPVREPRPDSVQGEFDYAHPVFDRAAIAAQKRLPTLQGAAHTWYAGAWTRYGFHEDGLSSGLAVAQAIRERLGDECAREAA